MDKGGAKAERGYPAQRGVHMTPATTTSVLKESQVLELYLQCTASLSVVPASFTT